MLSAFIDDGYTEDVTLPEIPGIAPEIRISFRPMTAGELGVHIHATEKMTEQEIRKAIAEQCASHIVSWDVRNSKNETVPIKAESMLKIKEHRFLSLWRVVKGDAAGTPAAKPGDDSKN